MSPFSGFPSGKVEMVAIPAPFFSDLLPQIDHLGEMKVTLYALWFLERSDEDVRYLTWHDFSADERLLAGMGKNKEAAEAALRYALEKSVQRGTLLRTRSENDSEEDALFFLNSPRGRAAAQAYLEGKWTPSGSHPTLRLNLERPNIFRLYEENIGPLTPLIADALKTAETAYPASWIEDAIRSSAQANKRSWRYIEAILKARLERSPDEANQRDPEKSYRRYLEGKYGDIGQH
jgi:DNA replication protein